MKYNSKKFIFLCVCAASAADAWSCAHCHKDTDSVLFLFSSNAINEWWRWRKWCRRNVRIEFVVRTAIDSIKNMRGNYMRLKWMDEHLNMRLGCEMTKIFHSRGIDTRKQHTFSFIGKWFGVWTPRFGDWPEQMMKSTRQSRKVTVQAPQRFKVIEGPRKIL